MSVSHLLSDERKRRITDKSRKVTPRPDTWEEKEADENRSKEESLRRRKNTGRDL